MKVSPGTFDGGIHPIYSKGPTENKPLIVAPLPKLVRIPLTQHIGAPAKPVVKVGDEVMTGQVIAEAGGFVSVPQHSSISGKVKGVKNYPHPFGGKMPAIEIESDGRDEKVASDGPPADWRSLNSDDITARIREAGIVGLGGAAFPTHVKLSPPEGKVIKYLLINGAECEPYLTCDHRLMLERTDEILEGIFIMKKVLGSENVFVGVEKNKPDAIELLRKKTANADDVTIIVCETKYPQGNELHLMKAVLDIELPKTKLPMEAGVVVQNVGTAYAVYEAIVKGKSLYERALTICGRGISEPANYIVRMGTLFEDIIELGGGIKPGIGNIGKLIMGGPMMGLAQCRMDVPVVKGTSGILLMPELDIVREEHLACIRCGKCETHCPMKLPAARLGVSSEFGDFNAAEELDVMECMECGTCAYVCPSMRPMTQFMRVAKAAVLEKRAKRRIAGG